MHFVTVWGGAADTAGTTGAAAMPGVEQLFVAVVPVADITSDVL
jgi:hypothetical protein